jgi:hypothetical protein
MGPMEKPVSIVICGVLNLIFGGMNLISIPALLLFELIQRKLGSQMGPPNPVLQAMQENPALRAWTLIGSVFGFLAGMVLVAAGVGLLKGRPWARLWSIYYAIYAIVMAGVALVMNALFLFPILLEQARKASDPAVMGGAVGGMIGAVFGSCFGVIYPIVLLFIMTRPRVKEYLAWRAQQESAQDGSAPPPAPVL